MKTAQSLTIYLLKRPIQKTMNALTKEMFLAEITVGKKRQMVPHREHTLAEDPSSRDRLYIRTPIELRSPPWTSFLSDGLENRTALDDLRVANASALLVIVVDGRQFALTFGHGRHMLNPRAIEERFGLRATLNSIAADSIKSIDKQTFDGMPSLSRIQTVAASAIDAYAMDVESELLRAIVGKTQPEHSAVMGNAVAGMDALKITAPVNFLALKSTLSYALERAECDDYKDVDSTDDKASFDWVDNLFQIRDKDRADELNSSLLSNLRNRELDSIWLAIPEILDWERVKCFAYLDDQSERSGAGDDSPIVTHGPHKEDQPRATYSTLDIETFVTTLRSNASIKTLTNRRIHVIYDDGHQVSFPAYKCIYAEVVTETSVSVLTAGSWYEIKPNFNHELNLYISGIRQISSAHFFEYSHSSEADYSNNVATASQTHIVLDQDLVSHGGSKNRVEVCYLFGLKTGNARRDQLIHLKRGKGSSTLSHLFAQALVSAELLHYEPTFRTATKSKLIAKGGDFAKTKWNSNKIEIVIGIIHGSVKKGLTLPFFSKINLRNAAHRMKGWGYEVCLLHVPEAQSILDARKVKAATKRANNKLQIAAPP